MGSVRRHADRCRPRNGLPAVPGQDAESAPVGLHICSFAAPSTAPQPNDTHPRGGHTGGGPASCCRRMSRTVSRRGEWRPRAAVTARSMAEAGWVSMSHSIRTHSWSGLRVCFASSARARCHTGASRQSRRAVASATARCLRSATAAREAHRGPSRPGRTRGAGMLGDHLGARRSAGGKLSGFA